MSFTRYSATHFGVIHTSGETENKKEGYVEELYIYAKNPTNNNWIEASLSNPSECLAAILNSAFESKKEVSFELSKYSTISSILVENKIVFSVFDNILNDCLASTFIGNIAAITKSIYTRFQEIHHIKYGKDYEDFFYAQNAYSYNSIEICKSIFIERIALMPTSIATINWFQFVADISKWLNRSEKNWSLLNIITIDVILNYANNIDEVYRNSRSIIPKIYNIIKNDEERLSINNSYWEYLDKIIEITTIIKKHMI